MDRPLVDPKAFELAEYFLRPERIEDHASEDQKWELAKVIQDAVEGWFTNGGDARHLLTCSMVKHPNCTQCDCGAI